MIKSGAVSAVQSIHLPHPELQTPWPFMCLINLCLLCQWLKTQDCAGVFVVLPVVSHTGPLLTLDLCVLGQRELFLYLMR